jgi:hypothetical protein
MIEMSKPLPKDHHRVLLHAQMRVQFLVLLEGFTFQERCHCLLPLLIQGQDLLLDLQSSGRQCFPK